MRAGGAARRCTRLKPVYPLGRLAQGGVFPLGRRGLIVAHYNAPFTVPQVYTAFVSSHNGCESNPIMNTPKRAI